jgi:hypothetical protein
MHLGRGSALHIIAIMLSTTSTAAAQYWSVDAAAQDQQGKVSAVASVASSDADHLRIYRSANGEVWLSLRLRVGSEALDPSSCPTYQVQGNSSADAKIVSPCTVDDSGVRIKLGQIRNDEIESEMLLSLMDGDTLHLTLKLTGLGYRRTTVSLRRSRQALLKVLGTNTNVVAYR